MELSLQRVVPSVMNRLLAVAGVLAVAQTTDDVETNSILLMYCEL